MPYQGKWICCLRPVKNMYLNKKTCGFLGSLYDNFTTPFSNCISNIRKEVSIFTILPQRTNVRGDGLQQIPWLLEWLLDLPSIYMATNNFPQGPPEKFKFCHNHAKEEITVPPYTYLCTFQGGETTLHRCLLH